MTGYCFEQCFNKGKARGKFVLDFECVSSCYHKYLHAMKTVNASVIKEGRQNYSEYVAKSMGEEPRDRFLEHVFPIGGHPAAQGSVDVRRKFFESYHYSDPLKAGR